MGLMRNKNLEAEYSKALEDLGLDLELSVLSEEEIEETEEIDDKGKKEN